MTESNKEGHFEKEEKENISRWKRLETLPGLGIGFIFLTVLLYQVTLYLFFLPHLSSLRACGWSQRRWASTPSWSCFCGTCCWPPRCRDPASHGSLTHPLLFSTLHQSSTTSRLSYLRGRCGSSLSGAALIDARYGFIWSRVHSKMLIYLVLMMMSQVNNRRGSPDHPSLCCEGPPTWRRHHDGCY